MSTEQGLLETIWEHPHDDVPRLVYSDWLEEQGGADNEARAEVIRVQIDLARLPGSDPRFDGLERRETELLQGWQKKWWAALPKGCRKGHFHRGFPVPHLGAFSIPGLVRLGAERLRTAPLWTYHYGGYGTDLDPLLAWPWLHRLKLFALRSPVPDDWANRLAECDNLRNVSELDLLDWHIRADELRRLLDVWADRHLSDFRASPSVPGDFVTVLVSHPTVGSLRRLDLSYCRLSRDDVARFVRGRQVTNLVALGIGYNRFGDEGLAELLAWPPCPWARTWPSGAAPGRSRASSACRGPRGGRRPAAGGPARGGRSRWR
jgi:uncharacterized protein (TIGR02996 family)